MRQENADIKQAQDTTLLHMVGADVLGVSSKPVRCCSAHLQQ